MKRIPALLTSVAFIICICVFPIAAAAADEALELTIRPEVVVESFSVSGGSLLSDKSVVLSLTISNKSPDTPVSDLVITYGTNPNALYSVLGQSNRQFVGDIDARSEVKIDVELLIADNVQGVVELGIEMQYKAKGWADFFTVHSSLYFPIIATNSEALGLTIRPEVVIESFSVSGGSLMSGKSVVLSLTICNKSPDTPISDLVITYDTNPNTLYSVFGQSNRQFVGDIGARSAVTIDVELLIADNLQGTVELGLEMQYKAKGWADFYSVHSALYLPIIAANSFSSQVEVGGTAFSNMPTAVSSTFSNFAAGVMYDLSVTISGGFKEEFITEEFGNLEQGRQANMSCAVLYDEAGVTDYITVEYSFYDKYGNLFKTDPQKYAVNVVDLAATSSGGMPETRVWNDSMVDASIFVASGVVLIGVAAVNLMKRMKKIKPPGRIGTPSPRSKR